MTMGIYQIRNCVSGKLYIGQSNDTDQRWRKHTYLGRNNGVGPLYDAMRKYGVHNFTFQVICECDSRDDMNDLEIWFIESLRTSVDFDGYNLRLGPVATMHESTKEKLRQANLGKTIPIEVRAKLGRPLTQERKDSLSRRMRGVPKSDAQRRKISEANKGRVHSPETIAKIVAKTRGQKLSEEARRNQSIGKTGRKATPEHALNIAIGQARHIYRTTGRIDFLLEA